MVEETHDSHASSQHVFISYSSSDRIRIDGLGVLLKALGHDVFIDHRTIKAGMRWEAELQRGLDSANVLLVYWTKYASLSHWVRREVEYFQVNRQDHLLVPILGDETPLSELLKTRQHVDFCPIINELLEMKRTMERHKATQPQIQQAILMRLREAGVEIKESDRKRLFTLFAPTNLLALTVAPIVLFQLLGDRTIEAVLQLSGMQVALVAATFMSGVLFCNIADRTTDATGLGSISNMKQLAGACGCPQTDPRCLGFERLYGCPPECKKMLESDENKRACEDHVYAVLAGRKRVEESRKAISAACENSYDSNNKEICLMAYRGIFTRSPGHTKEPLTEAEIVQTALKAKGTVYALELSILGKPTDYNFDKWYREWNKKEQGDQEAWRALLERFGGWPKRP